MELQAQTLNEGTPTECAIRLIAPQKVQRIPTHIILLIDVSESMSDERKLENVKHCCSLILDLLNDQDRISLITFGDQSEILLQRCAADSSHRETIRQKIQSLHCDGSTNLSAGLLNVRQVCAEDAQKAGLLILTDGQANRGVCDTDALRNIIKQFQQEMPQLSIHSVAQGHTHNENLLRGFAEDAQGSQNVVTGIEDTAFAFGDTLGGLMSCAAQNLVVSLPKDSVVRGPQKVSETDGRVNVRQGDLQAGTKPLLLATIPTEVLGMGVQVSGILLPELTNQKGTVGFTPLSERSADIELTKYRFVCKEILEDLQGWDRLSTEKRQGMEARIGVFETALKDSFQDGNAVATMLAEEVKNLRTLLGRARLGRFDASERVTVSQHITTLGLGRGISSPIGPVRRTHARRNIPDPVPQTPIRRFRMTSDSDEEVAQEENPVDFARTAVFQNDVQSQIASMMRLASQRETISDEDAQGNA